MRKFSKILALLLAVCLIGGVFALVASADTTTPTLQLSDTGVKPGSFDENFKGTLNLAKASKFYNEDNVDGQTVVQDYGYYRSSVPSIVTDGTDRYLMFTHKGSSVTSGNNYLRISPYGKWVAASIDGYYLNDQVVVTDFDMTAFDVNGDGVADAPSSFNIKQVAVNASDTAKVANKTVGITIGDRFSTVPGEWVHITVISYLDSTDTTKLVINVYADGEFVGSKSVTHAQDEETLGISYYNFSLEGDDIAANDTELPRFQFALDQFTTNFYTPSTYVTKADEGSEYTFANLIADPANAAPLYLYKDLVFYYDNYESFFKHANVATVDGKGYKLLDVALANVKEGSIITTTKEILNFNPNGVENFTVYAPAFTLDATVNKDYVKDEIVGGWIVSPKDLTKFPVVFKYNGNVVAKGYINADKELEVPGFFSEDPSTGIFTKVNSWVYDEPFDGTTDLVSYEVFGATDLEDIWNANFTDYETTTADGTAIPLEFTAEADAEVETLTVTGYAQYDMTISGIATLTEYANDVDGFAAALAEATVGNFTVYTDVDTTLTVKSGSIVTVDMNGNKLAAGFAGEGNVTLKNAIVTAATLTGGDAVITVGEGNKFYGTDLSALSIEDGALIKANLVDDNGTLTAICAILAGEDAVTVTWNDANEEVFLTETWYKGSVVTHPAGPSMSDTDRFRTVDNTDTPYYGWCTLTNGYTAPTALTGDTVYNIDTNVLVPVALDIKGILYNVNLDTSFDIMVYTPIYYTLEENGSYKQYTELPAGVEFVSGKATAGATGAADVYYPVGLTTEDGKALYANACYRQVSARKVQDTVNVTYTLKLDGVECTYATGAIGIKTYTDAVYAAYDCGSPEATLMTAMLNYFVEFSTTNFGTGWVSASNIAKTCSAVQEGGAHSDCACQTKLAEYLAAADIAGDGEKLTDGVDYNKEGSKFTGFTVHIFNEPSIAAIVNIEDCAYWSTGFGSGKINAYRYTYTNYLGETVSEVKLIKSFTTGGFDDTYKIGDTEGYLKCQGIYICDVLGTVTIDLITINADMNEPGVQDEVVAAMENRVDHDAYEVLETAQYSFAEYYESLVVDEATNANPIKMVKNIYALEAAARAYRTSK